MNYFPVFEPSEERIAAIQQAASEEANPLAAHYDASRDNRAKGAAFYTFSNDEETRMREMEELRKAREDTQAARRATGAVDILPGEGEGLAGEVKVDTMRNEADSTKSRAMEKRKREIEERRALIEAKRRKMKGISEPTTSVPKEGSPQSLPATNDPFAALETQLKGTATNEKSKGSGKSRWDKGPNKKTGMVEADNFLSQLERDLISRGK